MAIASLKQILQLQHPILIALKNGRFCVAVKLLLKPDHQIPAASVTVPPEDIENPTTENRNTSQANGSHGNVAVDVSNADSPPTSEDSLTMITRSNTNNDDGSNGLRTVAILVATASFSVPYNLSAVFVQLLDPSTKILHIGDFLFFAGDTRTEIFYVLVLTSCSYMVSMGVIMNLVLKKSLPREAAIMTFIAGLSLSGVFVVVVIDRTPTFTASICSINISSVWLVWVFVASFILFPFLLILVDKLGRLVYAHFCVHVQRTEPRDLNV